MVFSKLNKSIKYNENKSIDDEDNGFNTTLYLLNMYNHDITIALGKPKHTFSKYNIIYYPIYLIVNDEVICKIGLYELEAKNLLVYIDDEGDVDVKRLGEPLLYSFVDYQFILNSNSGSNEKYYEDKDLQRNENGIIVIDDFPFNTDVPPEPMTDYIEEDDIFKLNIPENKMSETKTKADLVIKEGIFKITKQNMNVVLLDEETENIANEIKNNYKESSKNEWIQKFTKNNNYSIIDNEGGGDCLFAVIRDAFDSIGQTTTVSKLRSLLALHLTDEVFKEYRELFFNFENEIREFEKEIDKLKEMNKIYKSRIKKSNTEEEKEKIIKEAKQIIQTHNFKTKELKEIRKLQTDYVGYMKDIDTIDKFREYIQTSKFWGDTWAISTLEELLKIKLIILSEESYFNNAYDTVLNCGEASKNVISSGNFEPKFYIITSYTGNHYKLITYKNKKIFVFSEIPFDIKILIINKCLEKSAGIYYNIQDFRNFKTKLGLNPNEGEPESSEDENSNENANSTIFVFYHNSMDGKPRKGTSEHFDNSRITDFKNLFKIENWRRKLDDMWVAPFTLDGHRWASVENYVHASKFKKGFPDFYLKFSLDIPSELSKDPKIAKINGDMSKKKNAEFRPKNVKIDVDFYLGRHEIEREVAIFSKFSQNEDLKQLLISTQDAILKHYVKGEPPIVDDILMNVRTKLLGK